MEQKMAVLDRLRTYMDRLIETSDAQNPQWNMEKIQSGQPNKWNYIDGCMIHAILELYQCSKDEKYLRFADSFMDWFVQEDGSIRNYSTEEYNLDNVNPAKNLFVLYEATGKEKYRRAVDTVYQQLKNMPRTKDGNFWHKKIYPNQVWLDGLYMAQPFYMEYETKYNHLEQYNDIFQQFLNVQKHMKDEKTGLYFHGYDESRKMYWANKETGCSQNFWLRAIGWLAVALTDTLEQMDEQIYYEYRELEAMLKNLIDALLPYQDAGGMFYQIVNHAEVPENYLETSGTALLAYAILKAVRLELLPERYRVFGERAFFGTIEKYLKTDTNGQLVLGGICLVAGLGGAQHRDGTIAYYLSELVVENEAKGVAPLLMAYTEIIRKKDGRNYTV